MIAPYGSYYRIRVFPSGKRVRQLVLNGRVLETQDMARTKQTKAKRSLRRARRRIGL